MQFNRPKRRQMAESVVPMINVVFLLLIFFMMSARIAPPPPFDLTLPATAQDAPLTEEMTLYISGTGEVNFEGQSDAEAWARLATRETSRSLILRADAQLPAPMLAKILAQLAGAGFGSVTLAVRAP